MKCRKIIALNLNFLILMKIIFFFYNSDQKKYILTLMNNFKLRCVHIFDSDISATRGRYIKQIFSKTFYFFHLFDTYTHIHFFVKKIKQKYFKSNIIVVF